MLWTLVFPYSQSNRASDNTYTDKNSRNEKASWNFWQVPAPCEWNYFNFEFSYIWQKIPKVFEIYDSLRKELQEEEFD